MVRILLIAMLGLALSVPQGLMMGDAYSKSDTGGANKGKADKGGSKQGADGSKSDTGGANKGSGKGKADKGGSKQGADNSKGSAGQKTGGQSKSKSSSASKSASSAGTSGGGPKAKSKKGESPSGSTSGSRPANAGKTASGGFGSGMLNSGKLAASVGATKAMASRTARGLEARAQLPGRLRPERGSGRDINRPQIQLAVQGVFGMLALPTRSPVAACRGAVLASALPLGAERVQVGSAGRVRRRGEGLSAPIDVSIQYPGEIRRARVNCRLNSMGVVTALH